MKPEETQQFVCKAYLKVMDMLVDQGNHKLPETMEEKYIFAITAMQIINEYLFDYDGYGNSVEGMRKLIDECRKMICKTLDILY